MSAPTLSFEELEALHDVLEAARCYWHPQPELHTPAAKALRLVNSLYWRLGEELPKTGKPSERFLPVMHSSQGNNVQQILDFILEDLTREYTKANDPWWADTVVAPSSLKSVLSNAELRELHDSLRKLDLTIEFRADIDRLIATRKDLGPWTNGQVHDDS